MFTNFYTFFISYIFIICSSLGYGFLIEKFVNKSNSIRNLGYIGLSGVFFLIIYSYLSSLFIGHGLIHNSILLGFGFLIFLIKTNFLKNLLSKDYSLLFLIFAVLIFGLFIFKTHDDFSYYHFQYSYYLTQQKVVLGIGNFDLGLRTPSSIFYLNSLFYLPIIKFFTFQITPALILGFCNLLIILKIKRDLNENRYNFLTIYNLLIFIFINTFFYRLSEHGTDKSAQILVLILFSEILLFTNFKVNFEKNLSKMLLLIGLIISFKAFYILYAVFFILVLYRLLSLKLKFNQLLKFFSKNIYSLGFISLFFLIMIHNFYSSGCLLYPVSVTCFDENLWGIKVKEVIELNNWYEQWAKGGAGPNFRVENPEIYIRNFNWVSNWFNIYFFNKISDFILGLSILTFVTFLVLKSKKKEPIKKRNKIFLIFLIVILLIEWFWNHPALRYGGYCLIASLVFIFFSILMEKFKNEKKILGRKLFYLILITFVIFSSRNFQRIQYEIVNYNYEPLNEFYYNMEKRNFNLQNTISNLIANYKNCEKLNEMCDNSLNEIIKVDKKNEKYIFYREK
tara:strand:- start:7371 stop:9065 length:1695 start_codon:yes stop_codon:yes gene_type:complete